MENGVTVARGRTGCEDTLQNANATLKNANERLRMELAALGGAHGAPYVERERERERERELRERERKSYDGERLVGQ